MDQKLRDDQLAEFCSAARRNKRTSKSCETLSRKELHENGIHSLSTKPSSANKSLLEFPLKLGNLIKNIKLNESLCF